MLRVFAALLLIGTAVGFATGSFERFALYPFDPRSAPPPAGMTETRLHTEDGETLVIWSAPPKPGKALVVYFHGNAGNLAARSGRFEAFMRQGFGIVAAGYRGSSGSTGKATESALRADARLLRTKAARIAGAASVIYYGESLGSAVAISLAVEVAPAALVLEAPFASIAAMARHLYGSAALARVMASQWPSVERITRLEAPLLILHGDLDTLVPRAQVQAVFDAAGSADKRLLTIETAGHNDVWQVEAQRQLYRFMARF